MLCVRKAAAGSAHRPPATCRRPMCINPRRKVPAVMTTARARSVAPQMVRTPVTSPFSVSTSVTSSCQMCRCSVCSSLCRHVVMNRARSHCARGLHMAGPFERFSIRNCMAVASVTSPIPPPSASTSRTICPLAMPPTAGLQLICATLFMSMVTRQVSAPMRAAAEAASQPAWPAPTTTTSYLKTVLITDEKRNPGSRVGQCGTKGAPRYPGRVVGGKSTSFWQSCTLHPPICCNRNPLLPDSYAPCSVALFN